LIDPHSPLEEGDLVALSIANRDGSFRDVMFGWWEGPTGRDGGGRFVKEGSADEYYSLGWFKYCARDVERGRFKIVGKVLTARDCGERLAPPPKAS
jgi:hypothetical protein